MLKRNRLVSLTLLPIFFIPNLPTPFHNQAWQLIENKADKKEMVLRTNELGLIENPFIVKTKKLKEDNDKKTEEERLRKQKEPEEQKKNEPQWQEFELTFYSNLDMENYSGCGGITSTGHKLFDGVVASNHYKINTKIKLQGWGEVVVLDRGSNKYFNNDYRLDVYIPRDNGESDNAYFKRVNKMGRIKVKGQIIK